MLCALKWHRKLCFKRCGNVYILTVKLVLHCIPCDSWGGYVRGVSGGGEYVHRGDGHVRIRLVLSQGTIPYLFLKNFGRHMSFCRATDTPVLDFWWRLPRVSKSEWAALFVIMFVGNTPVLDLMSNLGFKARMEPLTCVLCHLCTMICSDSPLVWHLLTSWQSVCRPSHFKPQICIQALVGLESRIGFLR